jgi:parvulin-like peptidyl-prolyl isomerase
MGKFEIYVKHLQCNYRRLVNLFVLLSILSFTNCSQNKRTDLVAIVGDKVITCEKYISRYQNSLIKTGLNDNLKRRYDFLRMLIDETILLDYAKSSGFSQRPDIINKINSKRDQVYINYYYENHIYPELDVTEHEVREAFRRSNIRIRARHLYAPTLQDAWKIREKLDSGSTFEELAGEYFKDPTLANTGGYLGWFSFDEMDPAFEDVAYSLEIGEISNPIKTGNGYSIIQVMEREINPFMLEHEFRKNENWIRMQVKRRKSIEFLDQKTNEILTELNVSFNRELVEYLYNKLPDIKSKLISGDLPEARTLNLEGDVLESINGVWDINKTLLKLAELQKKQWNRINSIGDFYDTLKGLAIREEIERRIYEENIPENLEVIKLVKQYKESEIIKNLLQEIYDKTEISEEELRNYYTEHQNELISPEQFEVAEIVVEDSTLAEEIANQVNDGAEFEKLAREHSVSTRSSDIGGYLGWGEVSQFGAFSDKITSVKVGDIVGPIKLGHKHFLVKILDKRESELLSFDTSKDKIREILLPEKQRNAYYEFIGKLKEDIDIWINEDLVNTLVISGKRVAL